MTDLNSLKYTAEHEWIAIDGDVATVGITDYAADKLGDVVFVELPAVDSSVSAGAGRRRDRVDEVGRRALRAADRRRRRGQSRRSSMTPRWSTATRSATAGSSRCASTARHSPSCSTATPTSHSRAARSERGTTRSHVPVGGTLAGSPIATSGRMPPRRRSCWTRSGTTRVDALVQAAVPASIHVQSRVRPATSRPRRPRPRRSPSCARSPRRTVRRGR